MSQISVTPSPPPNTRPLWQRSVAISVGLWVECRRAERWRREVVYQTRKLNRCVDKGKSADGGQQVKKLPLCCCVFAEALLTSLKRIQISTTISLIFGLFCKYISQQSSPLSSFNHPSILHSLFLNFLPVSSKLSSVHFLPRDYFMALSKQTANWASFPLGNFFFLLPPPPRSLCYSSPLLFSVLIA